MQVAGRGGRQLAVPRHGLTFGADDPADRLGVSTGVIGVLVLDQIRHAHFDQAPRLLGRADASYNFV